MTEAPTFTLRLRLEFVLSGDQTGLQAALLREAAEMLEDSALIDQVADRWAAQEPAVAVEGIISRLQIYEQLKRVISPLLISSALPGPGWRVDGP